MKTETIKTKIKKSYGDIAKGDNSGGCCNNTVCSTNDSFSSMTVDYNIIEGYHKDADNTADVVISNCVMNLVPDKEKAFSEVHRVLKTGGHFSISDIVYSGTLPNGIFEATEMHAGCVAGASEKGSYLGILKSVGFKNIQIKKERLISLPDELLLQYVTDDELKAYKKTNSGIYSITVYADKLDKGACCENTDNGCCVSGTKTANRAEIASCCETTGESDSGCC